MKYAMVEIFSEFGKRGKTERISAIVSDPQEALLKTDYPTSLGFSLKGQAIELSPGGTIVPMKTYRLIPLAEDIKCE